jgi:hypothetical protein
MIFAGGIRLRRGGALIGAIGVSGGDGNQDQIVATAGRRGVPELSTCLQWIPVRGLSDKFYPHLPEFTHLRA